MSLQDLLEEWHHPPGLGTVLARGLVCALGVLLQSPLQPAHHSLPEGQGSSKPRRFRLPSGRVVFLLLQLLGLAAQVLPDLPAKDLDQRHHPPVPEVRLYPDRKFRLRQRHHMFQALLDLVDPVHNRLGHPHLGPDEGLPLDHGSNHWSRRLRDIS